MRILAVDIGTGTQDILLFDSSKVVENCVKMVVTSPTAIVAERIEAATACSQPILFTGVTMGGGPCKRALTRHTARGLAAYATEEAALTFHDDLEEVRGMGMTIVAADEVSGLPDLEAIELKDIDLRAIEGAVEAFGVDCRFDAVAVAVLDHGFAPRGISNRVFRFEHLRRLVGQRNELGAFAYLEEEVPDYLTRMKAVAKSLDVDVPLLLLDTGVAAALGALRDNEVYRQRDVVTVNLGNSHTIAFHLHGESIQGLFEHHTGLLTTPGLDLLIAKLVRGTLSNEEVFEAGGHGAVVVNGGECEPAIVAIGPRRNVMAQSSLRPYMAVPYGDTMLAGCYGLVSACALRRDAWREEIEQALSGNSR